MEQMKDEFVSVVSHELRTPMHKRACNVTDLIQQSVDAMRAMAEKTEVSLEANAIPVQVWVDPDRIIQTLTNLLSNAIKFSPSGTTVSVMVEDLSALQASTSNSVRIAVKDQGQGIPEDKLEAIFDRFEQLDASNAGHQGGTGLGLAICRSIVQQHDGQIWVESKIGQGSTFYFTLPLYQQ